MLCNRSGQKLAEADGALSRENVVGYSMDT
jgi:hypothetical protein